MKVSSRVAEQAAGLSKDDFVRRSLLNLAFQQGGEARKVEVAAELKRGREYWCIALDLGASPALVRELGGPAI